MGYTHYFKQQKTIPLEKWKLISEKLSLVFERKPMHSESAGGYFKGQPLHICDGLGMELITSASGLFYDGSDSIFDEDPDRPTGELILFNGDDRNGASLGHEGFFITRIDQLKGPCDGFCKTARKPYDWLVVATLLLLENEAPGCYEISSDGSIEDWLPCAQQLTAILQQPIELPKSIGIMRLEPLFKSSDGLKPSGLFWKDQIGNNSDVDAYF